MKTSTETITNARLKVEVSLHIVNEQMQMDTLNKRVLGTIHSFKTDKILDAYVNGSIQPALQTQFIVSDVDFTGNVEKQVNDYIDENLTKLVSV